jgi:hypothetical protein
MRTHVLQPAVRVPSRLLLLVLAWLCALSALQHPIPLSQVTAPAAPKTAPAAGQFAKLPLAFVPNAGQTDPAVRFQARALGGSIFFTSEEVVLSLPTSSPQAARADRNRDLSEPATDDSLPAVVRLRFDQASREAEVVGIDRLPGIVNYFLGNDPAKWCTNLPT